MFVFVLCEVHTSDLAVLQVFADAADALNRASVLHHIDRVNFEIHKKRVITEKDDLNTSAAFGVTRVPEDIIVPLDVLPAAAVEEEKRRRSAHDQDEGEAFLRRALRVLLHTFSGATLPVWRTCAH